MRVWKRRIANNVSHDYDDVPHEICQVSRRNVAFAGAIQSLEGGVGLECLRLAQILSAEFNSLFSFTGVGQQFCKFLLCHY